MRIQTSIPLLLAMGFFAGSCVTPFEARELEGFEAALVVEATLTDELKAQEIRLSRASRLEADEVDYVSNAEVRVTDARGAEFTFGETAPGTYRSNIEFGVEPGGIYQLHITTDDGRAYRSEEEAFSGISRIDSLYAERVITDLGEEGMAIFIDASEPAAGAKHYRYEYEETYKIIAPKWVPDDLMPNEIGVPVLVTRPVEERVCYATDLASGIRLRSTNEVDENTIKRFLVRFINRNNYILSHRYSILVRQILHSERAYNFFGTLNDFAVSESLLSENQPGFFQGNVSAVDNGDEKVLGYFEVASVSEKRIFFNYDDYFAGERLPPYVNACINSAPPLIKLTSQIELNLIKYVGENTDPNSAGGPYLVVTRECGDCTALGSPEVPAFWVE